ncbi:hypothetical protein [Leekyejoonella antrihumi]|uniref:Uncharacterized protein n=1 Tax=Leekyejoonella antrihumi TaxID=1660198 RepID=A0A563E072_9MICO|nr:hypothetical protein [Leekyejoonella antrihumi]TWP35906.1 hypothetical protein FGL98_11765 [Leekyejoonella antrihumi]
MSRTSFTALLIPTMLAFSLALEWTYQHVVSPTYSYLGERYREPNAVPYWLAFITLLLVAQFLPRRVVDVEAFILWILYILVITPLMLVPHYADICTPHQASILSITAALTFLLIIGIGRVIPRDILPVLSLPPQIFWWLIAAMTIGSYAYIFSTAGFKFASLDLTQVYSIRNSYRDIILSSGPILGYVVRLQGNVINPFLIARGATGGSRWLILIGLLGQFFIYSVTGYKLTILSGIAVLLAIWFFRTRRRSGIALVGGTLVAVMLAVATDLLRGSTTMTAIFVDRLILVSGNLPAAYFAVFTGQPHALWSSGFLSGLTSSPYQMNPGFIVGNYLTGNSHVLANSNYVADGYANFGYLGIAIEAVVAGLIIALVVSAARRHRPVLAAGVLLTPVIALVNSSPITAILSDGFAMAALLLVLAPDNMLVARKDRTMSPTEDGASARRGLRATSGTFTRSSWRRGSLRTSKVPNGSRR